LQREQKITSNGSAPSLKKSNSEMPPELLNQKLIVGEESLKAAKGGLM
jgi:hypothetical protein